MQRKRQPAVWYTNFPGWPANRGKFKFIELDDGDDGWSSRRENHPRIRIPVGLRDCSFRHGEKFARWAPDFFMADTRRLVVSQKFHDLLVQFDMGDNELIELPFFENDGVTPRPERFWLLVPASDKPALDVENSSIGPDAYIDKGEYHRIPNLLTYYENPGNYLFNSATAERGEGQIALYSEVLDGADMWCDRRIPDVIFFSDRLKRAIKETKIKARRLQLARVVLTERKAET